jgi:hypothetical protein
LRLELALGPSYDANGNAITRQGRSIAWFSYNYPTAISTGSGSTAESVSFAYGPELPAPAISPRRPEDDITGRFLSPDTHIPDSATNKARILSRYNPMLDKISAKERVSMRRLRRQTGLRDTS